MSENTTPITIAIDGYSSSGKSSMAKKLARTIGYRYIDSGAMYRAVTLYAMRHGMIAPDHSVSPVAAIPAVRHALVEMQQSLGRSKGIVMDGRDIGTTVFPDAEMKVFVTASPQTRAQRRLAELIAKGSQTTFEEVLANVVERDHIDETRAESPLRKAPDAFLLDNSEMTPDMQNRVLLDLYHRTIAGSR